MISTWDIKIKLFFKCRQSAKCEIFENCCFGYLTCVYMRFYICYPNFTHIGQHGVEIQKKKFSIWRPTAILNLQNFDFFLSNDHPRNGNSWDMDIKLFSKWRPWPISACDSSSPIRISLLKAIIAPRYSQKTTFNMSDGRHLEFEKFSIFVKRPFSEWKFASAYQIWS